MGPAPFSEFRLPAGGLEDIRRLVEAVSGALASESSAIGILGPGGEPCLSNFLLARHLDGARRITVNWAHPHLLPWTACHWSNQCEGESWGAQKPPPTLALASVPPCCTTLDATGRPRRLLQLGNRALEWENFYSATVSESRKLCHRRGELFRANRCPSIPMTPDSMERQDV